MSEKPNKEDTKRRLDWHSGFEGGLMLSFRKYAKDIEIEREHPLSKEPLRVDFLVIKKRHDVVIDNAIGRKFKTYNLIEYKNPNDELDIDVLWKVIGYACLYKSMGPTVDAIKSDEITMSIFRSRKPVKLFKRLTNSGISVEKVNEGIYSVVGLVAIPIYIVVIRELTDDGLKAISIMSPDADEETVRRFLNEADGYTEPDDKRFTDAVLRISTTVNQTLYEKLKGVNSMAYLGFMAEELDQARKETAEKYDKIIAEKDETIAEKDETIANLMAEITRLKENK
jgi:hypothetical protein